MDGYLSFFLFTSIEAIEFGFSIYGAHTKKFSAQFPYVEFLKLSKRNTNESNQFKNKFLLFEKIMRKFSFKTHTN